jgi:hypothetical protein
LLILLPDVCAHCKKRFIIFPFPAWMSLNKFYLARNNLIIAVQGEFG